MIVTRLFGERSWLADREACAALYRKLEDLGLQEPDPEDMYVTSSTALGRELQVDLVMVFVGLMDEWEVPIILGHYGLLDAHANDARPVAAPDNMFRAAYM